VCTQRHGAGGPVSDLKICGELVAQLPSGPQCGSAGARGLPCSSLSSGGPAAGRTLGTRTYRRRGHARVVCICVEDPDRLVWDDVLPDQLANCWLLLLLDDPSDCRRCDRPPGAATLNLKFKRG
jgi:hypothetical protein